MRAKQDGKGLIPLWPFSGKQVENETLRQDDQTGTILRGKGGEA